MNIERPAFNTHLLIMVPKMNDKAHPMTGKVTPQKVTLGRLERLSEERKAILSLPPNKALDRIMTSAEPIPLVHSFPEEDLYYLINDIGPEDSLPLLAMASDKQLDFIFDSEIWDRDRIEVKSVTRWLNLLLQADAKRSIHWLLRERTEFVEYYLNKSLEVVIREHDQDPSDFGDRFFTIDDTFYVRILEDPLAEGADNFTDKIRKETIQRFLKDLAVVDYFSYQKLLMESVSVIPAETEEENYRLRNVRLAEKGFIPFEEAVGVYQPLDAQDLKVTAQKKTAETTVGKLPVPVSFYPLKVLAERNLFSEALRRIRSDRVAQQLQSEFAGLCNRIIVADQRKIRTKEELKSAVDKAAGYLTIGLRQIISETDTAASREAARWLETATLSDIFRVGFGTAVHLKRRAEQWQKRAWFEKAGLPLSFWGEEWLGTLGGLLIKRPLFFDNYRSGELYREFASMKDIQTTESVLEEIIAFDDLLSRMAVEITVRYRYMTHKSLILTHWARHFLGLSEAFGPIPVDRFKEFFNALFLHDRTPEVDTTRQTNLSIKETLLAWLSEASGLSPFDISRRLGATLERLFQEIENELGSVSEEDLDPKYIYLFHLIE